MRVYLAHQFAYRQLGEVVTRLLELLGYEVYNPFRNTDQTGSGEYIFNRDLEAIGESDCVLAILKRGETGWGVCMEMMYAYTIGKPVVCYLLSPEMRNHPFLSFTQVCTEWREVEASLKVLSMGRGEDVSERVGTD
ncbi:MAG: hypothetical protein DRO12_05075 [Thermoprotei archaeon]|nr:MAG: hypothetical protein DRO12_05075 [Thermoprotei archaeon]